MRKTTVVRLNKLCNMLNQNSHRWGDNPSQRMCNWVDEYNEARGTAVWDEFCTKYGYTLDHDAYDCMA